MKKPKITKKTKKVVGPTLEEQKTALIEMLQSSMDDEESMAFLKFMLEVKKKYEVELLIKQDKGRPAKEFAYLRVSTRDQSFGSQLTALHKAGINISQDDCFSDKMSGGISDRDGWNDMVATLQKGDTVIVYHIDRVGRDTIDNLQKIRFLLGNGINIKVVTLPFPLNANSSITDIVVAVLSAIGQSQKERQNASIKLGIEARKASGKRVGPIPYSKAVRNDIYNLYMQGLSAYEIRQQIKDRHGMSKMIARQTLYRIINEFKLTDLQREQHKEARKAYRSNKKTLSLDGGYLSDEDSKLFGVNDSDE